MRKSKTILQQLFDGELFPSETINDSESRKISNSIADKRECLAEKLSESDKKILEELNNEYIELSSVYGDQCFSCGFRLGALLLIEVFNHDISDPEQIGG